MNKENLKKTAAQAALNYIQNDSIIGVGTGSTVNYFIDALASIKHRIEATVASSIATRDRLKSHGIPVYDLNSVHEIPIYVDGTDEINQHFQCIKGGGGALTGEKIVVATAKKFICIADDSKRVKLLGQAPLPIEVIPLARSYVAREIVKLKGDPIYREGFVTDFGNVILDVYNLEILDAVKLEQLLNNIPGVITNGLFAQRPADILLLGTANGVETYQR